MLWRLLFAAGSSRSPSRNLQPHAQVSPALQAVLSRPDSQALSRHKCCVMPNYRPAIMPVHAGWPSQSTQIYSSNADHSPAVATAANENDCVIDQPKYQTNQKVIECSNIQHATSRALGSAQHSTACISRTTVAQNKPESVHCMWVQQHTGLLTPVGIFHGG